MKPLIRKIKSPFVYHILIWLIIIVFKLIVDYSILGSFLLLTNAKIFISAAVIFYLNYFKGLPWLVGLPKKKVVWIIVIFAAVYFGIMFLTMPPMHPMRPPVFPRGKFPDPEHLRPIIPQISLHDIVFKIGLFALFFSTLIFFVDQWNENRKTIRTLEYERQSSELKVLREQINPHFFFNALNSIYSLSITRSPDTSRVVLILSDIMRYVLNSRDDKKNNLNAEIENIKKYIEIQTIRFSKFNGINYKFWGNFAGYQIEPLLLLTFVENAFKYADFEKGPLTLNCHLCDDVLQFDVCNFYGRRDEDGSKSRLGLQNSRRKLELLYPDQHQLEITDNGFSYEIKLKIKLIPT